MSDPETVESSDHIDSQDNSELKLEDEASTFNEFSTKLLENYSDLMAIDGKSFLRSDNNLNTTLDQSNLIILTNSSNSNNQNQNQPINRSPNQQQLPPLINLTSDTPIRLYGNVQSSREPRKSLLDESVSNIILLDHHVLTPTKPVSPSTRNRFKTQLRFDQNRNPASISSLNTNTISTTPPRSPRLGYPLVRRKSFDNCSSPTGKTLSNQVISTITRSKSSADIPRPCLNQGVTKSILRRPNSPSKGARARFFSPRVNQIQKDSDQEVIDDHDSSWTDEYGNLRGREIVHEFEKDAPPSHIRSVLTSDTTTRSPRKANPSITKKHHHPPRFTVPEPVELGIEPILPIRCSTSPSPSPPPILKPSYLMNFRSMIGQPSQSETNSFSNSLNLTAQSQLLDNYSNIFDESGGGFLGEGMITINERSTTEQSIDVNHLTLMGILGSGGRVCGAGIEPRKLQSVNNRIDKSHREMTDGLDDHAMNLKQRLEAMRETEDDGSVDVNGLVEQMERARAICDERPLNEEQAPSQEFSTTFDLSKQLSILNPLVQSSENVTSEWKRDELEEILVESILEKVEAKRKKNNMLATTSTKSVVAKDQTHKACLQLEGNSKLKKISIEKTVVRTDGNIRNQLNQDQSEGDVDKMRTVKTLDSLTAPLTSRVTFEKPRSLPPPSSLLRPRKTMPNLGLLEAPTNLSLATAKKTSSETSLPPNSSSAVQKPGSTTSTANTITRTTRLEKRLSAPLSLNSNASRPPLSDTSIKKPRFMATATTISTTGKIPSSRRSDAMLLSKPAGLGAKKTKLKPSTEDRGKNGSPRVLKTRSSISSELINPSIGSGINSRLAKRESLVVSKATIPSSIKSSASASTLVKKGTTINVEKRRSMIEINSRCAMARTGESTNQKEDYVAPKTGDIAREMGPRNNRKIDGEGIEKGLLKEETGDDERRKGSMMVKSKESKIGVLGSTVNNLNITKNNTVQGGGVGLNPMCSGSSRLPSSLSSLRSRDLNRRVAVGMRDPIEELSLGGNAGRLSNFGVIRSGTNHSQPTVSNRKL